MAKYNFNLITQSGKTQRRVYIGFVRASLTSTIVVVISDNSSSAWYAAKSPRAAGMKVAYCCRTSLPVQSAIVLGLHRRWQPLPPLAVVIAAAAVAFAALSRNSSGGGNGDRLQGRLMSHYHTLLPTYPFIIQMDACLMYVLNICTCTFV